MFTIMKNVHVFNKTESLFWQPSFNSKYVTLKIISKIFMSLKLGVN